jgi:plasmid stability protein
LEAGALVSELPESVEDEVDDFLADGVVSSCEVVRSIFLAGDELLWVLELSVSAGSDLIDYGRLEIDEDSARDVLACACFGEEGVECVVTASDGLVGRHLAVRLDAVFKAE